MGFGNRLAEERKRMGLKQSEFALLVGTDVPKQSLYETGKRDLRADYLARLAGAGVDVVYILTGERTEGSRLGESASELLSHYLALPPDVQQSVLSVAESLQRHFTAGAATVHASRNSYRAE